MARAYSQDLRDRVIDAGLSGTPARHAAVGFGGGIATAIRWVRRARESADRRAGQQGQPRRSKLNPHRDYIIGLVAETPDMTISEMLERLGADRGVRAGPAALWGFLLRCRVALTKQSRHRG